MSEKNKIYLQRIIHYLIHGFTDPDKIIIDLYTFMELLSWKNIIDLNSPFIEMLNTLRLRQSGCQFADNIFKCEVTDTSQGTMS